METDQQQKSPSPSRPQPRIQGVPQRVTDEVEPQDREHDGHAREEERHQAPLVKNL